MRRIEKTKCGSSGQASKISNRHNPPRSRWLADFETTTDPTDCRVWGWGLTNIDEDAPDVEFGEDIDSFFERMAMMNAQVYFHNLAFDGSFILDHLLRLNYRLLTDGRLMKGEFETVISDSGKFYSITVRWRTGKRTEFRDSLKKLPMSVSKIARSFQLEEEKGSIDYHVHREIGHKLTEEEKSYIANDVVIVARALRQQLNEGMTKLTVGSDSLAEYKNIVGRKTFSRMFPTLSFEMDAEIRRAYRGGWTLADKRFRGRVQERRGMVFDVNSLYPSVMYDRVMPFGEPTFYEGGPDNRAYPLFICALTFTARLKPGYVPCIQIKGFNQFAPNIYQEVIDEPVSLCCTNIDLALWQEHYDLDIISWDGVWYFSGVTGVFKDYIDKWMHVKATSTGGLREIAKLHLNSLYGKFATNPNVTGKYPVMENDVVRLVLGREEYRDPVYTPMGVFITSYARDVTIRAAQQHYDIFAYADTDSLHLFTDEIPDTLDVDPVRLGAWKHEMDFDKSVYIRPKVYTERDAHTGELSTHIAGLPYDIQKQVTFDDYFNGHEFKGKLTPKRVPGGIVLTETSWSLTDPSLTPEWLSV